MEVTLSQKDLQALAEIVGAKINRDMFNAHVSQEAHDQMKKIASSYVSIHVNENNFQADVQEILTKMLDRSGRQMLREIVYGALVDVLGSEKELVRLARQTIAKAAKEEADKVAERLNLFDDE